MNIKDIVIKTIQPLEILRVDTCEKNDIVSDVITGNVLYKGEDIPVYFKAYAFSYPHIAKGDRGLLNEIIGYLVCHLHKVPQPEQAFFVLMPKEKLTHLWGNLNERIKKSYESADIIPMFATQRIYSKSMAIRYSHSMYAVENELRKWKHFKKALVCDEAMANTDRLPRNILTINSKDFWLIDNGKLAIEDGTNWRRAGLIDDYHYSNYLADLVIKDVQADHRKGSAIIGVASSRTKMFKDIVLECEFWIDMLASDDDKKDWKEFLKFLQSRDHNITRILSKRYGMLSL